MTQDKDNERPEIDREFIDGYMDGLDPTLPEPNNNRHPAYVHSFYVGRAELSRKPIPAAASRAKAKLIQENLP